MLNGWGTRPYQWEFSASVQRQITSNVSFDVGYFRRWYGNFGVTDNLNLTAADYSTFSVTAPIDPRLPNGGGYVVSGFYDLNPNKVTVPQNNYFTLASNYGEQIQHWNGIDLTINAGSGAGSPCRAASAPAGRRPTTAPSSPRCRKRRSSPRRTATRRTTS